MIEHPDDALRANDYQIGGTHYKSEYEHWDLALVIPYSYLEAALTAYLTRWKQKGGAQDLKKAVHFLNKLQEEGYNHPRFLKPAEVVVEVGRFAQVNKLGDLERRICEILGLWDRKADLDEARSLLFALLDEAEAPLTEENHHADRVVRE